MVGRVDRSDVVAQAADVFNAFEPSVRRNVAIIFSRMRREGGYDTYALAAVAMRRAGGDPLPPAALRGADKHAARSLVDAIDAMGDGPEAVRMRKRIACLLHGMLASVGRLPESLRAEAVEDAVALAVDAVPLPRPAATRAGAPAHA